jgi:hypothetical protein
MTDITREISNMIEYQTVDAMLSVAVRTAPSALVQQAFGKMVNEMRSAGESNTTIVLALTDGVQDGLRHGNWPGLASCIQAGPSDIPLPASFSEVVEMIVRKDR